MSGLSLDQLPYLRGLRGLGSQADELELRAIKVRPADPVLASALEQQAAALRKQEAAPTRTTTTRGRSSARAAVDRSNARAEPVQQTIDRSQTFIEATRIAERPQRVSPLGVSWQFGLQPGAPAFDPYRREGISMGWILAGGAALLGAAALYLTFRKG